MLPATAIGHCKNREIIPAFSPLVFGLYEIFGRIVWSICVSYIIFACIHNSGGPINWFLSLPMWQPISKLSYSLFLVQGVVMTPINTRHSFSEMGLIQDCISLVVLCIFAAIPVTLMFELPIDAITKLATASKKQKIPSSSLSIGNVNGCDENKLKEQ